MKPPLLKVAIITGAESVNIKAEGAFQVESENNLPVECQSGHINISLKESHPAPIEKWLWCAKYAEEQGALEYADLLKKKGLQVKLWEIGKTPRNDLWHPREYRLLIRIDSEENKQQIIREISDIVPVESHVEIDLPAGAPSGVLQIEVNNEAISSYSVNIRILSDYPLAIMNALVGRGFHWEHAEDLNLPSPLWISIGSDGKLCAGTEIDMESYLVSVNSSEMPADSPQEFLKSQVIAARSWLLANWGSHHPGEPYIVCAGDHCQCYYGLSRIEDSSRKAGASTFGLTLMYEGRICDARYAKTCGGVTEPSFNVWHFSDEAYMGHLRDLPDSEPIDLSEEAGFRSFQMLDNSSDSCCAPGYANLEGRLGELAELYRWKVEVQRGELSEIINLKTGSDIGEIKQVTPIARGPSGRLITVLVTGQHGELKIEPELEIRRILSRTHLPSSAFWVEEKGTDTLIFHGAGWGHGAGMCQMGAASLALRGRTYDMILDHYYPRTSIQKIY
ncbi:hypothetical protein CEE37_03885 [candidate division LCP-89 bacterium B3_LCP]|uniref:Sporulation stage II protein D amidase enhancer LytB N-terminal domain-containing protein n=1 Tax=candidate division LCP-89 bacterium B3_LCP TaxID=2012998 RepID=A0A532V3Z7_UNCL8|nr:MAG: hypothetical protein CEE37_03885 [candidate division LCP-89 bacterium B3_LCP]